MRELIFRKIVQRCLDRDCPWLKQIQLQILMNQSAKAFRRPPEKLLFKPYGKALKLYAEATAKWLGEGADAEEIYRCAFKLGSFVRKITGFRDKEDLRKLVFALYKNIKITMEGSLPGEICVSSCYFAGIYTPEKCRLMSAFDAGIITGIFGGGDFSFSERLTEGCPCCRAALTKEVSDR